MTKGRQRRKVSGAVLVMVLIVMVVLIIMLMATLTVVTTAGQRIYTKYEENQAYYSARSALDIFTQNLLEDAEYYAYDSSGAIVQYNYTDNTGAAATANMKQGLALQLELYKIRSQAQQTSVVAKSQNSLLSDADAKLAMDFAENMDSGDVFTAGTPEDNNYSASATLDSITYQVTLPTLKDPKASGTQQSYYGEMVDQSAGVQKATIKVEVLDRMYDMAGNYGNNEDEIRKNLCYLFAGKDTDGSTLSTTEKNNKIAALKNDIKNGDRSKDKFKLKVTSTVTYLGHEATAVLIYDSSERPAVNSNRAITTVNDISQGSGVFPIGGASALSTGEFKINQGAVAVGNLFLKGSLSTDGGSDTYMFKDTTHTVFGDVTFQNSYFDWKEAGSVLYSQGNVNLGIATNYGEAGKETNIVATTVKFVGDGRDAQYYGEIFCDTFYIDNGTAGGDTPVISGSIHTNYVDIKSYAPTIIPGSTSAISLNGILNSNIDALASQMNVAKGFIFNVNDGAGNIVPEKFDYDIVNGKFIRVSNPAETYVYDTTTGDPMPLFTFGSSEVKINYYDPTHYSYENDTKVFTLPANLAGRGTDELEIATVKSLYKDIFKDAAFVNNATDTGTNGELNALTKPTFDVSTMAAVNYTSSDGSVALTFSPQLLAKFEADQLATKNSWELDSYLDTYITEGIITAADKNAIKAKWDNEVISWSPYSEVFGVKNTVSSEIEIAKNNDTTYQTALAAYYQNYITGAEKAGEVGCDDLIKFTSSTAPLVAHGMSDVDGSGVAYVTNPEDFATGGKYENLATNSGVITESGYIKSNTSYGSSSSPVIIDARTNDIIIQLGAESGIGGNTESSSAPTFKGHFVVVGDKTVKIYLPDGRDYNLGETNETNAFNIATYDIRYATNLKLGSSGTGLTKSPNVYMYAGNNVENIYVNSPDEHKLITAHIYVPFANYNMSAGANSGKLYSSVTYNGETVYGESTFGYSVVGSLIAASYKSNNKTGVAYINPAVTSTEAGDPHLTWTPDKYVRN
ncbi:MAG: hypothetical protein IJ035_10100 [Oscillospiraceae bacterium]|nr:hypothetical protein [Oscillospiraceae bacterium]